MQNNNLVCFEPARMKGYLKLQVFKKWHRVMVFISLVISFLSPIKASNFNDSFDITWGKDHTKISNDGQIVQLALDKTSGNLLDYIEKSQCQHIIIF